MGSTNTSFTFSTSAAEAIQADVVIVPVYQTESKNSKTKKTTRSVKETASYKSVNKALQGVPAETIKDEKFNAAKGKTLYFRRTPKDSLKAKRVILLGLGAPDKLHPHDLDKHFTKAFRQATLIHDLKHIAVVMPEDTKHMSANDFIYVITDSVHQSTYFSQEAQSPRKGVGKVSVIVSKSASAGQKEALLIGDVLGNARSYGKDLTNCPANIKTTDTLVERARSIGKKSRMTTTVQANLKWLEKNMPCFFEVARGSLVTDPPKFITIQYKPSGKVKKKIAIVGKSVIFDTGGYQVKPGAYMNTMKADMTGGAFTLATMDAIAALQPSNIEITAYLAATPNKIDSGAMIPDSIVNTTCGKKVEIRHTDAEGRLTLIDGVAKASEKKPDEILTIATLTGSASSAVGLFVALMGNNPALERRVYDAGDALGEPIQQLKVVDADYANIRSKLDGADIINTNQGKTRGAQTAGAFVMSGAPSGMPMAHMDIAGADMTGDEKATGIGQRAVIQYLLNENSRLGGSIKKATSKASSSSKAKKTIKK